jgi:hypothetical protein
MDSILRRAIALWLPTAVAVTGLTGVVYAAVQQTLRESANDPQLEIARDAAARLSTGAAPQDVASGASVDLARSLAPYEIVFDEHGAVLASTAVLDGATPRPPIGVLRTATDDGENTLTWQPRSDVRTAIDVVPWSSPTGSGTVLAGRSLQEVEQREDELTLLIGAGWVALLLGAAAASLGGSWLWASSPLARRAKRG